MMKKIISFMTVLIMLLGVIGTTQAASVQKETFVYSVRGADTLRLDKYNAPSITGTKPCVIFAFGGGFTHGSRDDAKYLDYFNRLVEQGFVVVSVDYRLGMRVILEAEDHTNLDVMTFGAVLSNTVYTAVADYFDATNFVLKHAKDWGVNTDQIIANGSSAGAIIVLEAEYLIANEMDMAQVLPKGFNYAGVISFAGAILNTKGNLTWKNKPAPILLFHGDADRNVPFEKMELLGTGLYGSNNIAASLDNSNNPYYFYKAVNADHSVATTPMTENMDEINSFIDKFVLKNEPLIINVSETVIGKPEMKKNFEIMDFVKSNFDM